MAPCRDRPDDDIPVLLPVPTYHTTLASHVIRDLV